MLASGEGLPGERHLHAFETCEALIEIGSEHRDCEESSENHGARLYDGVTSAVCSFSVSRVVTEKLQTADVTPLPRPLPRRQRHLEFLRRHRTAAEETLDHLAMLPPQKRALLLGLHYFRHDAEFERAGHGDHRGDDGPIIGVSREIADEVLIDLHRVDRKTLQVAERGVAGTEV